MIRTQPTDSYAKFLIAPRALVKVPNRGYRRLNLTSRDVPFALAYKYVIAYAPIKIPLQVLAVFHGRRNPLVMAAILRGRE